MVRKTQKSQECKTFGEKNWCKTNTKFSCKKILKFSCKKIQKF